MIRTLAAAVVLLLVTAAEAASLRTSVVVDAPVVTLGDLLTEAGAAADTVVAQAPPPGQRLLLGGERIGAVARAAGLAWRPRSTLVRVVVRRASRDIGATEIALRIAAGLAKEVPDARFRVVLGNRASVLHLPTGTAPTLGLASLTFDAASGRFDAVVVGAAGTDAETRLAVSGRAMRVVSVPVLAHRLGRDEVITADDIDWIDLRGDRVGATIVTDVADLIGRVQRRPLKPGRAIRARDVRLPRLVNKGDVVVLSLRTPFMSLTMTGRALEDGALGKTVRVLNTTSKRVIEAVVAGANRATVATPMALASVR